MGLSTTTGLWSCAFVNVVWSVSLPFHIRMQRYLNSTTDDVILSLLCWTGCKILPGLSVHYSWINIGEFMDGGLFRNNYLFLPQT